MGRKQKPLTPEPQETQLDTSSLFADIKESDVEMPKESPKIPAAQPTDISDAKPKRGRPRNVDAPPAETIVCGNDEANALLDLLQPATAWAARRIYNVSPEVASRAFVYSPSHREKINPPLIRVMNKWLPGMVKRWSDEIGLAVVLGSVINAQITVMKIYDAQEKQQQAAAKRAATVTEIPKPEPAQSAPAAD